MSPVKKVSSSKRARRRKGSMRDIRAQEARGCWVSLGGQLYLLEKTARKRCGLENMISHALWGVDIGENTSGM
jgi:hypothetical protein